MLWQKERLLNLAVKAVPPDVRNIAWLDCDVIFERSDWADAADKQLENGGVVQLFSDILDLSADEEGATADHRRSPPSGHAAVGLIQDGKLTRAEVARLIEGVAQARSRCVGIAMAAPREILEDHGLYDAMVIGGGVRALLAALYGQFDTLSNTYNLNAARREHYLNWARPFCRAVGDRVGYLEGRLYHLWHGDAGNRKYSDRHQKFSKLDFDPQADLVVGANGAWHWARSRPDLEEFFVNYFNSRAEDG